MTEPVHLHGRAGQRVGELRDDARSARVQCGLCGALWWARISERYKRAFGIQCVKCGAHAGVEKEIGP